LKGRDEFERKLERLKIDLGQVFWEHDRVFVPRGYRRDCGFPRLVLRTEMRAVDRPPKYYLILKRHIGDSNVEIEQKTAVKDYLEAVGIVQQLGFVASSEVSRKRQEARTSGGERLFLDNIDNNVGNYAKLETEIREGEKTEEARKRLLEIFSRLREENFIYQSYAEMVKPKA
ncbi:hypothetical protein IJH89_01170, partial [Candidatus Saccharibacteria bacterium]|nr:hypothetical protein [Candidatus Saccharibacteria bacterium]